MKNIKTWLIHKLGGFTEEECERASSQCYENGSITGCFKGINKAYEEIKAYAESLNGCDAESWCLQVWNYINTHYNG